MSDPAPPAPAARPAPPAPPPPPELLPALAAFERGDFRAARQLAGDLLASRPAAEVETAARALQGRMAIDPWAFRVGLIAAAVLALIIGAYVI
jgi:hypothetical protein